MHSGQAPARQRPVIRVFVSSTFSDFVAERNALADQVWPELERYCRQRGFTFQAIDLRWGVPSEAGLDHRTMQICFEELHRAQETSPKPNFLILLGNKYGWRPLPETISEPEYDRLFEHAQTLTEQGTLAAWYRRDTNARPTHYVLRARTDSPDDEDYTRVPDAEGRLHDTAEWLAVQETLWSIVNRAYPDSLLAQRFTQGVGDIPASVRFQSSATEQEIWHGALRVDNARDHVVALFREIDRTGGDPAPSQLKQFIDLRPDQSRNDTVALALTELKTQVEQKLAPEPILRANCRWEKDANGQFTGEVTADHIASMCEAILTRLREIVLRQINDYWGADLSAENATVAAVRGSQQALDLELRDHRRFAQERGPVDLFVGRDEQLRTIREYLQSTTNRPLIVRGPSGSGKTALLAYVAQRPFLPGVDSSGASPLILTRFIGAHPESSTLRGLVTSLCRELRIHFPVDDPFPDSLQKLIEEFYSQLGRATVKQPIYVFLDALDQLEAADQAREVDWLRSTIPPQAGDAPCHARIVASCLSPSPEFPAESEACEPFRRFQSRGLLADDELGALSEPAARQLVRRWLTDQQRGLTDEQWHQVDAAIHGSSACRQPLYLKVLQEQLRNWPEFKAPEPLPPSLSLLIQERLTTLCQPNQHGPLPRIALGYLVSARYGLSEGELLEILLCDAEMQAQLEAAEKAYGHRLPRDAKRYPVAPWARLRSDLRVYLSERAAPGTTVLYCYHRQVEQAVRTLFLADEVTRSERRHRLADYFDGRWDQPDAHALMELPDLLLVLPDYRRLYDRLTNFAFPMRKAEIGLLESIADDYSRLGAARPADMHAPLDVWQDFFRERAHILRRGVENQSVDKILLQLALEHADDSPITHAAEVWLSEDRCDWFRLQRVPRYPHIPKDACLLVLEGHKYGIDGALPLPDGRVVSWAGETMRIWNTENAKCERVLVGHTGSIKSVELDGDDQLVSWSADNTLRFWDIASGTDQIVRRFPSWIDDMLSLPNGRGLIWSKSFLYLVDIEDGAVIATMTGHRGTIKGVLPLPDDQIVSWSQFADDYTLRLWDANAGNCLAVFEGHESEINGARSLPNSKLLSWSSDETLRMWDRKSGDCPVVFKGHSHRVLGALELSDDRIISWSRDKTLRIWNIATAKCIGIFAGHSDDVNGALSLPEDRILSWSNDKTLRLWDVNTGKCLGILEGHTSFVYGASLLPDGRLLSWSFDKTLRIWNIAIPSSVSLNEGHTRMVVGLTPFPDGRVISWSDDKTLRIWDGETGVCLHVLSGSPNPIFKALALPNERVLSWSTYWPSSDFTRDWTLRLWDASSGTLIAILQGEEEGAPEVLLMPNSRILSWNGTELRVWDGVTGVCLAVLKGHTGSVRGALLISEDRILSWSDDKTLRVWDGTTGDCLNVFEEHGDKVTGARLFPEGRVLSWSWDGALILWDVTSGTTQRAFKGHTGWLEDVLRLSDKPFVSWASDAYEMRLWDEDHDNCVAVLKGHTSYITGVLQLPGGRILSMSRDKALRLWNETSGACLHVFEGHTDTVSGAIAFAHDQLLSWSTDQTLRLWDIKTGACLAVATFEEQIATRHPEWLHAHMKIKNPEVVADEFWAQCLGTRVQICHKVIPSDLVSWESTSDEGFDATWTGPLFNAYFLLNDGTVLVRQYNKIYILKLYHGRRRVSLAEAEALLKPTMAPSPGS